MKRGIKLFWSYNISKTEKWLSKMAKEGYILTQVNTLTRIFSFEKSEPTNLTYKICYELSTNNEISPSLKKEGWESKVNTKKWSFISNNKNREEIKLNPSRDKLVKRNRFIKKIVNFSMILYSIISLPIFLLLTILGTLLGGGSLEVINFAAEGMPLIFYYFNYNLHSALFLLFLFGIYTVVKLNKVTKDIKLDDNVYEVSVDEENILLIPDEILISKRRFNWFYYPDKTISWLNEMESKGYNLCKIDKYGIKFFFKKAKPRKVKYVIDYQVESNENYYEIHKEDGWSLKFRSEGDSNQWCLWSKEYEDVEPEIYTYDEDRLSYAKQLAISHTIRFIPLILLGIFMIYSSLSREDVKYINAIIYFIVAIKYSQFYFNIIGYYLKAKKKIENI